MRHGWCTLLFSSLAALLMAPPLSAQTPSRFVPIEIDGDPQLILAQQLRRVQDLQALQKLLADSKKIDIDGFNKLVQDLKLTNPGVVKQLDTKGVPKLLDTQPDKKKPPPEAVQKVLEGLLENAKAEPSRPEKPPSLPPAFAKALPSAAPKPDMEERVLHWLQERMLDMENSRLADLFRDSPAWRDAMEDLQSLLTTGPRGLDLAQWAERWGPDLPKLLEGFNPSKLPLPALPSFNIELPGLSAPSLPGLGGALPGQGFFTVLEGLLWLALGIGIAVAVWFAVTRRRAELARRAAGWRLGPWPVDPAHIATPADLILAFDYLAMWRAGLEARAWNHRAIAARLATPDEAPPKQHAAAELAGLYEQARYAPDTVLDAASLAAARRDLCLLAGRPIS